MKSFQKLLYTQLLGKYSIFIAYYSPLLIILILDGDSKHVAHA